MKRFAAPLIATALLTMPGAAQADEGGYKIANGVGLGGLGTGVILGPTLTVAGLFIFANSAVNTVEGSGSGQGLFAGGAVLVVGTGLTMIAPAVVVGSSFAGNFAVKDMGGSPSLVPGIIGAAGVGVQIIGVVTFASAVSNLNANLGASTAMRVVGWFTGMIGGGVQLAVNGKQYRSASGRLSSSPKFKVTLIPTGNGVNLVGRF